MLYYILSGFIAMEGGDQYVQYSMATYDECEIRQTIVLLDAASEGLGTDVECYYIGPDRPSFYPVKVTSEWEPEG